jgi:hypothetical protein
MSKFEIKVEKKRVTAREELEQKIQSSDPINLSLETHFSYTISVRGAIFLLGNLIKKLKKENIKPDYVVLVGTTTFILNIPVGLLFHSILGYMPTILTPVIMRNREDFKKNENETKLQLKANKAKKDATYLILDVVAVSGKTLYIAKDFLNRNLKKTLRFIQQPLLV